MFGMHPANRKYSDCFRTDRSKYEDCLKKFLNSDLEVTVSSINNTEKKRLQQIIKEHQKTGKAVIFTFTPGPFKTSDELPNNWMEINPAIGCTAQLTAFEKAFPHLNAAVFNINTQSSAYQSGENGLLAYKKLNNLFMISDEAGELQKAFDLFTLTIPDQRYKNDKYLERFSIVIKPDNKAQIFELSSPVNEFKANEHIKEINQFISPRMQEELAYQNNGPLC